MMNFANADYPKLDAFVGQQLRMFESPLRHHGLEALERALRDKTVSISMASNLLNAMLCGLPLYQPYALAGRHVMRWDTLEVIAALDTYPGGYRIGSPSDVSVSMIADILSDLSHSEMGSPCAV